MFKKWLFPMACFVMAIISVLPPYSTTPYDPRQSQDVILSVLRISVQPYQYLGWIFHAATLLLVAFFFWKPDYAGRVLAGYIGLNYLVIAAIQPNAVTEKYGFVLLTGAMLGALVLGIIWLVVAARNTLKLTLKDIPGWQYLLLPLALLVFWSPVKVEGGSVFTNFDLRLLLTSADYGLTYCFVTPVFLFLLILFSTSYKSLAFRITAFNAFLYGLFNLAHWFNSNTIWMGVMHLPLIILSLLALYLSLPKRISALKPALNP